MLFCCKQIIQTLILPQPTLYAFLFSNGLKVQPKSVLFPEMKTQINFLCQSLVLKPDSSKLKPSKDRSQTCCYESKLTWISSMSSAKALVKFAGETTGFSGFGYFEAWGAFHQNAVATKLFAALRKLASGYSLEEV